MVLLFIAASEWHNAIADAEEIGAGGAGVAKNRRHKATKAKNAGECVFIVSWRLCGQSVFAR